MKLMTFEFTDNTTHYITMFINMYIFLPYLVGISLHEN